MQGWFGIIFNLTGEIYGKENAIDIQRGDLIRHCSAYCGSQEELLSAFKDIQKALIEKAMGGELDTRSMKDQMQKMLETAMVRRKL